MFSMDGFQRAAPLPCLSPFNSPTWQLDQSRSAGGAALACARGPARSVFPILASVHTEHDVREIYGHNARGGVSHVPRFPSSEDLRSKGCCICFAATMVRDEARCDCASVRRKQVTPSHARCMQCEALSHRRCSHAHMNVDTTDIHLQCISTTASCTIAHHTLRRPIR